MPTEIKAELTSQLQQERLIDHTTELQLMQYSPPLDLN